MNDTTIYTFGTQRRQLQELVELAQALDAVVCDVRYSPRSRVEHWNKRVMARALGERYRHMQGFGNINYKNGKPTELKDPAGALAETQAILDGGRSIILLCYEEHPEDCHRRLAARIVAEASGRPVQHLLRPGLAPKTPREAAQPALF
jgi:uncharacterized protein (DUF488 family)